METVTMPTSQPTVPSISVTSSSPLSTTLSTGNPVARTTASALGQYFVLGCMLGIAVRTLIKRPTLLFGKVVAYRRWSLTRGNNYTVFEWKRRKNVYVCGVFEWLYSAAVIFYIRPLTTQMNKHENLRHAKTGPIQAKSQAQVMGKYDANTCDYACAYACVRLVFTVA